MNLGFGWVFRRKFNLFCVVLVLSACSDTVDVISPVQEQATAEVSSLDYITYDDKLLALSEIIAGFTNMYYNAQGKLEVGLLESSPIYQSLDKATVEKAILSVFGPNALSNDESAQNIVPTDIVLQAEIYRFSDLYKWRIAARQLFADDGIQTLDIDDKTNRIKITVKTEAAKNKVASQLRAIGVPDGAVTFEYGETTPLDNLDSRVRPLIGGLNAYCTIGFPAVRNGVSGFITNSHCMDVMGGTTGTKVYQPGYPTKYSDDRVGTETVDPNFQVGSSGSNCPLTFRCRRSDSAFVTTHSNVAIRKGEIAKLSSNVITSTRYKVKWITYDTGAGTDPGTIFLSAAPIHKVGHTTGHTRVPGDGGAAEIDRCIDDSYTHNGQSYKFYCQSYVPGLRAGPGDSGSPVFSISRDGISVTAWGLLYGTRSVDGRVVGSYFSPISAVLNELGMSASSIIAP